MKGIFKHPVTWGVVFTGLTVLIAIFLAFSESCQGQTCNVRWELFLNSRPNEIGDTLAGFAGALAFVWIIVTVLLQGQELAAQREELKLTRQEFAKMADSQRKQVELLVKQGEIFQEEQQQRAQLESGKYFNELLLTLRKFVTSNSIDWRYFDSNANQKRSISISNSFPAVYSESDISIVMDTAIASLIKISNLPKGINITEVHPPEYDEIYPLLETLSELEKVFNSLSRADKERYRNIKILEYISKLDNVLSIGRTELQRVRQ